MHECRARPNQPAGLLAVFAEEKTSIEIYILKKISNERLEFLGDGILECITKFYLYKRFPDADEGFMTEKKISLVKNDHIGKLAYKIGLNKWFIISKNAEEKKRRAILNSLIIAVIRTNLTLDELKNCIKDVYTGGVINLDIFKNGGK
jgi:ribonuclease-3